MKRVQQGFTLIELMIVVAIIGILAAVAIPAYQDYTIRAKVTEGIGLAAAAKTAVSEYYLSRNTYPADNGSAGISTTISSQYVSSLALSGGGVITVSYNETNAGTGGTIIFTPTFSNGTVGWTCSSSSASVPPKYRPSNCRP